MVARPARASYLFSLGDGGESLVKSRLDLDFNASTNTLTSCVTPSLCNGVHSGSFVDGVKGFLHLSLGTVESLWSSLNPTLLSIQVRSFSMYSCCTESLGGGER